MRNQLFPAPFPDETVYSWICRFYFYAAHSDFKNVTLSLLGVKDSRPTNEFPPFLKKLAYLSGLELEKIIFDFTNIHYFQPFMEQNFYGSIWASLEKGDTSNIQSRIGSVANRITPGQLLKYCPLCVQDDRRKFGVSYWHRSHQLVGVTACVKHGVLFQAIKRDNKKPILPPIIGSLHQASMFELRLSELVINEIVDTGATWQKSDTYMAYYRKLDDMGMLTKARRIKHQQLKTVLKGQLSGLSKLQYPFPQIYQNVIDGKLSESLFYRTSCNHQPIKHFVLILSLFESWNEFKLTITTETKEVTEIQSTQLNIPNHVDWEEGLRLVSEGFSLRTVADRIGTTVSTLKIKAQQKILSVETRPSKITQQVERAIWRKLVVGKKTKDIASEFNLSVSAIEKILTGHLWLPELRKRIRYYDKLKHHESQISLYKNEHPYATRNEIREGVRQSYYWLYKNEQKLLYQALPKRVKAIYWPRK